MEVDDEKDESYDSSDSIKEQLETKRRELELELAMVMRALNLLGGNDQGEEIVRAVNDALGL